MLHRSCDHSSISCAKSMYLAVFGAADDSAVSAVALSEAKSASGDREKIGSSWIFMTHRQNYTNMVK